MRKVWVTRPKENNSFGAVKARFGIHVQPDVCNTKQWMVASHIVWLWKNFAAIVEEHDVIRKRRWVKKEV